MSTAVRLLSRDNLRDKGITFSKQHLNRLIKAKQFPRAVPLIPGGKTKGWVEDEIDAWLRKRVEQRDVPAAA